MWYLAQIGRASSRLLNALAGGEGDTTFSAYSYHLQETGRTPLGRAYGRLRVRAIDTLLGAGHCAAAHEWHQEHQLFQIDK